MKITVLMENTTTMPEIESEHGFSLYIETEKHKILFDAGQTDAFERNAQRLGVHVEDVDMAVLSHGHYDHSGGFSYFIEKNKKAPIYANRRVFEPYFNKDGNAIGLAEELKENERFVLLEDAYQIEEGLQIFSCNSNERPYGTDSSGIQKVVEGVLVPDDFLHEHYLLIEENGKKVLISGCSHKGILNIMEWFRPDVLIGGFHFMKMDPEGEGRENLEKAADILMKYQTQYYTGHCTGLEQYAFLEKRMDGRLHYASAGLEIVI